MKDDGRLQGRCGPIVLALLTFWAGVASLILAYLARR